MNTNCSFFIQSNCSFLVQSNLLSFHHSDRVKFCSAWYGWGSHTTFLGTRFQSSTYFHLVLNGLYDVLVGRHSGWPSANTWQVTYKSEHSLKINIIKIRFSFFIFLISRLPIYYCYPYKEAQYFILDKRLNLHTKIFSTVNCICPGETYL